MFCKHTLHCCVVVSGCMAFCRIFIHKAHVECLRQWLSFNNFYMHLLLYSALLHTSPREVCEINSFFSAWKRKDNFFVSPLRGFLMGCCSLCKFPSFDQCGIHHAAAKKIIREVNTTLSNRWREQKTDCITLYHFGKFAHDWPAARLYWERKNTLA